MRHQLALLVTKVAGVRFFARISLSEAASEAFEYESF